MEALTAVIEDLKKNNISRIVFLGDGVGYGPSPNEVLKLLRNISAVFLAGNHDWGAIGLFPLSNFTPLAKKSISWTSQVLEEKNKRFLTQLKQIKVENQITFVHSSPKEPEKWHYIFKQSEAKENLPFFDTPICFVGHTHRSFIFQANTKGETKFSHCEPSYFEYILLPHENRYIINVGSVGQPRDNDPRASYMIYDSEESKLIIRRIGYLAERLASGT